MPLQMKSLPITNNIDVLIIGSGAAGLSLALELADHVNVTILSKASLQYSSTKYAQGGISAVLSEEDSLDSHVEDTLNAGAGLCDPDIVNFTVSQGADRINWLIQQGMHFTQATDSQGNINYHLTREGGHSHRRVIHAADQGCSMLKNPLVFKYQIQVKSIVKKCFTNIVYLVFSQNIQWLHNRAKIPGL